MKRKKAKYIVSAEPVPKEEFGQCKVFQSIVNVYQGLTSGEDRKFVFVDEDGNVKERTARRVTCDSQIFHDSFGDDSLLCVKLIYNDGTWEYGLKWWHNKWLTRDGRKLVPLYLKDGYVNEETGEVEEPHKYDKDARVPAWLLKLIPWYNERIEDAVANKDTSIETEDLSLDDWRKLCEVMNSGYVSPTATYSEVPIGKTGKMRKCAATISFLRDTYWQPMMTTWKNNICVNEYGVSSSILDTKNTVVATYTYLKSIYKRRGEYKRVYGVMPVANLLSITKRKWSNEGNGYEDVEVWNNLDQTVVGNV